MDKAELRKRIVRVPGVCGGRPVIKGTRIDVVHMVGMLKAGETVESIVEAYDWLTPDDIKACQLYADEKPEEFAQAQRQQRGEE